MKGPSYSGLVLWALLGLGALGCVKPVSTGKISTEVLETAPVVRALQLEQTIQVGGVDQYIHVNGLRHDNPILLFVHDLPGQIYLEHAAVYSDSLRRHFTLVHWHQRGAGRSFGPYTSNAPLSIDLLVDDLHNLTELIARWFDKRRVILIGEGFGAMLAILAAAERPDLYWAVVGTGPVLDSPDALAHARAWTTREAHRRRHQEAVEVLEPGGVILSPDNPVSAESFAAISTWAGRLGGVVPGEDSEAWLQKKTKDSAVAPLPDILTQMSKGRVHSTERLWAELSRLRLSSRVTRLEVPLFLVAGAADQLSPITALRRFYKGVDATQGKTLVVLDAHGHWPLLEATERVIGLLAARVKPLATPETRPSPAR